MTQSLDEIVTPRLDTERFCPYHGGWIRLADAPIVATSDIYNTGGPAGGARPRRTAGGSGPSLSDSLRGDATESDDDAGGSDSGSTSGGSKGSGSGETRRKAATVYTVGRPVVSAVDRQERMVLAAPPGYEKRRFRSPGDLPSVLELVKQGAAPRARPARACPRCAHPLPTTIDHRNAYPVVLIGHTSASKTTTVVALIHEAGRRGAAAFGARQLNATGATEEYLYSLDNEVFSKFRQGKPLELTPPEHHPPMEFSTTLGVEGEAINLLLHDVSGEDLMDRDMILERAPAVLWADALVFIYDPLQSPVQRPDSTQKSQSTILNSVRDDLESRGGRDASGNTIGEPPLFVVVSKADYVTTDLDAVEQGAYSDEDVKQAIRGLDDGGVVNAAERFERVHWFFMAPMPAAGVGPRGVVRLFRSVLEEFGR